MPDGLKTATRETVAIPVSGGQLAGELAYAQEDRGVALLIGPHPYMGGSMNNNVVSQLAIGLAEAGIATLRFDHRPPAREQTAATMIEFWRSGHAPHDQQLVTDAAAALAWLTEQFASPPALVGYSFGAYVASEIIREQTPAAVMIAPTVCQHELPAMRESAVPKLVIFSSDDFATPMLATESWFAQLAEPKAKTCLVAAEHFFRGREGEVLQQALGFLEAPACPSRAEVTSHA